RARGEQRERPEADADAAGQRVAEIGERATDAGSRLPGTQRRRRSAAAGARREDAALGSGLARHRLRLLEHVGERERVVVLLALALLEHLLDRAPALLLPVDALEDGDRGASRVVVGRRLAPRRCLVVG